MSFLFTKIKKKKTFCLVDLLLYFFQYFMLLLSVLLSLGLIGYFSSFLRLILNLSNLKFLSISLILLFKGINSLERIVLPYPRSSFMCIFSIFYLFLNSSMILSLPLNYLKISKHFRLKSLLNTLKVGFFDRVHNQYLCIYRMYSRKLYIL